jgi:predicted DNA-binding mobile mystery protein A
MNEMDNLRLKQLDERLERFRELRSEPPPKRGWVHAIREALGMSSPQLAKRIKVRAAQSVEDMQDYEVSGTIKLQTLRKLANALECDLVYALVPRKPLQEIRRDQARIVASRQIKRAAHSMRLEEQRVSDELEAVELDRRVAKLLQGNPKKLWD